MCKKEDLMNRRITLHALFFFVFLILCLGQVSALTTRTPSGQTVEEGEVVEYYVEVTNEDHLFGVEIRIDVSQDHGGFETENEEFHLYPGQTDRCTIWVYTQGVKEDEIQTHAQYYKRGSNEDEFSEFGGTIFHTYIEHDQAGDFQSDSGSGDHTSNIMAMAGAVGFFALMVGGVYALKQSGIILPVIIPQYTNIKKEEVLEDTTRRCIYDYLCQNDKGMTFSEIKEGTGIRYKNSVHYQLRRLRQFSYVKKSGKFYYPNHVSVGKSFLEEIQDAMKAGYRTPTEIARHIGSYTRKVSYHMQKHGLWKARPYRQRHGSGEDEDSGRGSDVDADVEWGVLDEDL